VKTLHIGSLPFKDINQAIHYTFQYDIPTLFSLPQLDQDEWLGLDVLLKTEVASGDFDDLKVKSLSHAKIENYKPAYVEEFKKKLSHTGKKEMKLQCVGPVTLHSIIKRFRPIEYIEVALFLKKLYAHIGSFFPDEMDMIFFMDEPFLAQNFDSLPFFEEVYRDANALYDTFVVHCCDHLNQAQLKQIHYPLHLDLALYQNDQTKPSPMAIGIANESLQLRAFDLEQGEFIAPACGLGLKSEAYCWQILQQLKTIKSQIHQG
tara:strand:+ start:16348 stop:17133 length:786 start_codon:yes stop_codon:yes gene_type:complete